MKDRTTSEADAGLAPSSMPCDGAGAMTNHQAYGAADMEQPLGANLEPVLKRTCDSRLSAIGWFRTDWQRGGALTGYAEYRDDDDEPQPVVVKLPVPPAERFWLVRLQEADDLVPIVYASGETLDGYDMAWVVMERLPHGPLGSAWNGHQFDLLVEAAVRFFEASMTFPTPGASEPHDWEQVLYQTRQSVQQSGLVEAQRWNKVLKKAQRKVKSWLKIWSDRPTDHWCHGDLHLGNAMTREAPPQGPALLIDFAMTRPGCWVEDAVYFEHVYWSRPDLLQGRHLCRDISRKRKELGMAVDDDWPCLAQVKRALMAMSAPIQPNVNVQHLQAALELLEQEVG